MNPHLPCAQRLVAALAMVAACRGPNPRTPPTGHRAPALAIVHATLIDPTTGPRPDVAIVVEGDRIVRVGAAASTPIPPGAEVHDASGQFAIPGLWDAHVHVSQIGMDSAALLVANGVLTVRDMGSAFEDVARWRGARASGRPVPRVFSPGPKLDGKGDLFGDNWIVKSPSEGRSAVDRLRARGVDFIKVHYGLTRATYDAIADQCRTDGLSFAGHASDEFGPLVAVAAGQRTIEHGRGMVPCSAQERAAAASDRRLSTVCAPGDLADQILPAMARAGTALTPTLVSWRGQSLTRQAAARLDGMAYAPPALERRWLEGDDGQPPSALQVQLFAKFGPLAASAARAGVALLAGSDSGDPYVVPGFALHDELQLLVEAGVPPLQALRSATLEPARALGVADHLGSLDAGNAADLVLLSADPLADIRNTRRIAAVVLAGHWTSGAELAGLLPPLHRAASPR